MDLTMRVTVDWVEDGEPFFDDADGVESVVIELGDPATVDYQQYRITAVDGGLRVDKLDVRLLTVQPEAANVVVLKGRE